MTAPILMLVLLTGPYAVMGLVQSATGRERDLGQAAALGLALLFVLTGIGHFTDAESMARMLPPWFPGRVAIVYATGILEFALAAGFLFRRTRLLSGWAAAALLILFLPANVYAAMERVPQGGHAWGPVYLLVRAPLQAFILWWVYWFVLQRRRER